MKGRSIARLGSMPATSSLPSSLRRPLALGNATLDSTVAAWPEQGSRGDTITEDCTVTVVMSHLQSGLRRLEPLLC